MTGFPRWRDVRADVVTSAGREQAVAEARARSQVAVDAWRSASSEEPVRSPAACGQDVAHGWAVGDEDVGRVG